jgi:hypothetical protein
VAANQVLPVIRQHLAIALKVVPTGEIKVVKLQPNAKTPGSGFQHPQTLGHDFFANAVPGNDSDTVFGQDNLPLIRMKCEQSTTNA